MYPLFDLFPLLNPHSTILNTTTTTTTTHFYSSLAFSLCSSIPTRFLHQTPFQLVSFFFPLISLFIYIPLHFFLLILCFCMFICSALQFASVLFLKSQLICIIHFRELYNFKKIISLKCCSVQVFVVSLLNQLFSTKHAPINSLIIYFLQ